jgi:hypothetical protein
MLLPRRRTGVQGAQTGGCVTLPCCGVHGARGAGEEGLNGVNESVEDHFDADYGVDMTLPSEPTPRDRTRSGLMRSDVDRSRAEVVDLLTAAVVDTDEEPARRTVTRFLVVVAACLVLLILFAVVAIQGLTSAATVALKGSECTVPGCVEASLTEIETETGVDFPDGTTVEWSVRRVGLLADRALHFEVRIPAGAPVLDAPRAMYAPQPWESEPDPETGTNSRAENFVDRGLEDVRWTFGGWATGVEANGDTIVFGLDVVAD